MEKRYTNIVGTPVLFDDSVRPVTTIKDVVVDPERGVMLALVINNSKNQVISPRDILEWTSVIKIHNWDAIVDFEDILRVEEVLKSGFRLFGARVESEEGKFVGKVMDYAVDVNTGSVRKMYTGKGLLGLLRYDSRIIPTSRVVEMLPEKIIVNDDVKVKEEKRALKPEAAVR